MKNGRGMKLILIALVIALAVMLALAATPVFASPLTEYTDAEMAADIIGTRFVIGWSTSESKRQKCRR